MSIQKLSLLFVGAFPQLGKKVYGGNITDCKTLFDAGFAKHFDLILLDSTQRSVPASSFLQRLFDSLKRSWKYIGLVALLRPDSILIFTAAGFSFFEKSLFVAFGHFLSSRVLLFPRGGRLMDDCRRKKFYSRFVQFMLRFPDVLLCQAEVWRNFFINEMNLSPVKCIILKNWTATPSLLQIGTRRTYDAQERLRILFLGWVDRTKGIFELIDAFSILYSRFPKLELVIAGEGEASNEARKYVVQKGLNAVTNFLGWINEERKLKVLSDATIFCLPSYVEGLPNAMIEAMAAGLPVVVTPVGAIPNVICDRKNGLIVPVRESHSLALGLEELIVNPALRRRLGRCAHRTAKRNHSVGQAVVQLAKLVTNLK